MQIKIGLLGLAALVAACSEPIDVELRTTQSVAVYRSPDLPGAAGNRKVGELPPNVTLPAKREVLSKDVAAYEIEYEPSNGTKVRGYVLLGSSGLEARLTSPR